jgi:hypothetical protein
MNRVNNFAAITLEYFDKVLRADTKSEQAQIYGKKESKGAD